MRGRFTFSAAVLTVAVLVGWAVHELTADSNERYDLNQDGWVNSIDLMLVASHFGPVVSETWTVTPSSSTATFVPSSTPSSTPVATPTITPAPSATNTAIPTATPTTATGTDVCSGNPDCGTPRDFCSVTGPWAFCNDYRQVGATVFEMPFDTAGNNVSFDCLDTGTPSYEPSMLGGTLPGPMVFTKYEHFMTRMESGGFGDCLMRFHQPVDLTAERHLHVEMDLKADNTRNYGRIMLSPDLTKRDVDDRGGQAYPRSFIQLWFQNGDVKGSICRQGVCEGDSYPWGDAFASTYLANPPTGDNIRRDIDIYVSQTSIRVYIEGVLRVNDTFAPLGFDAAYLYLGQVSYNAAKNGQSSFAAQIMHWDSVAFDGPVLPLHGLTPRGYRHYIWNTYGATACSIGGYAAVAQTNGVIQGWTWTTWVALAPVSASLTRADISCAQGGGYGLAGEQHRGFEVIQP